MIIKIDKTTTVDTDTDLGPAERHVVQKLFGWKMMVDSVSQFREKKKKTLSEGWNKHGPVRESKALALIIKKFEKEIRERLSDKK